MRFPLVAIRTARRGPREGSAGLGAVSAAGGVPAEERGRRRAAGARPPERVADEGRRPANVNRALPINFCGGPDEITQLKEAREQIGCGVVGLSFQTPGSEHPDVLMEALKLFGKKVLPQIRDF
jgi:hypothetical protein